MTTYLLAGGGTAGHVNPLLATADELRLTEPTASIIVLGTAEGLESRLVPERGYELVTIAKLPFPRAISLSSLAYPLKLWAAISAVRRVIRQRGVDVVVGFGGYAAAPAYLAAKRENIAIVVHEANAIPGIANKLGARLTNHVGVTFADTPLANSVHVGMPLRSEIATLDRSARRAEGLEHFGLDSTKPVLLVTGGSTGAARINSTLAHSAADIVAIGWQIIHTVGDHRDFVDPQIPGYHAMRYCDRMDLALSVADLVIARSGAATVSELSGLGIPAVFVPYPVGNGEQVRNAAEVVEAGGANVCVDKDFTPEFVRATIIPLLCDEDARAHMSRQSATVGIRDGARRLAAMIHAAVGASA